MADEKDPEVIVAREGPVGIVKFNRPKRYNAWTPSMRSAMIAALDSLAKDPSIQAAIITGEGKYYCSGVDFASALSKFQLPRTVCRQAELGNLALFEPFLSFPKPLIAAINGPAIGACVTSAVLCDVRLAADTATFLTPFKALGLPAEGCSSFTFPRLFGEERARLLLQNDKKLTATEALDYGLVQEVLPGSQLLGRARAVALEWAQQNRPRTIVQNGWLPKLKEVNAEESKALGRAVVSLPFLEAQYQFHQKRNNKGPARAFWIAKTFHPILSRL
eukprot:gb/GEZN01015153.1/.p1 GENE.gb/GEZN01015153.1/~~gb/GEZN01015153.1/.p1  ORF type:complete len:276 (+),score=33.61 gb/GEZN01015153.1/:19-846(+)